jgi:hypothetical protein
MLDAEPDQQIRRCHEHRVFDDEKRLGAERGETSESVLDLVGPTDLHEM